MKKNILISKDVLDGILDYSKTIHPKEGVLLLIGKTNKDELSINGLQIPPFTTHGHSFSTFPLHMLPIDFSVMGTAHSHPSGLLQPSDGDLNNFYGRIMIIAAFPYNSEQQIAVFNSEGKTLEYTIE